MPYPARPFWDVSKPVRTRSNLPGFAECSTALYLPSIAGLVLPYSKLFKPSWTSLALPGPSRTCLYLP